MLTQPLWRQAWAELPGTIACPAASRHDPQTRAAFAACYTRLQGLARPARRRLLRQLGVGLAGAALLLALGRVPSALAATITVNGDGSGGTCSLADAITAANTNAASGNCPAGDLTVDTINLTVDVTVTTPLPELSSTMIVAGNGHKMAGFEIDFRLLQVLSMVSIKETTLSLGTADLGGAIFNAGTLSLQNCLLSSNAAVVSGPPPILRHSTVSGNAPNVPSGNGGAIYNTGVLTVQNSTISGNSASSRGGGIFNSGTLTVQNSTLSGNTAGGAGGAIYNTGLLIVQNSTLAGNSAAGAGGGLDNTGTLTVQSSTLSGSWTAGRGAGIHNSSWLTVQNSTLYGNSAGQFGGGIYNAGALTVLDSTLSGNAAGNSGGGLYTFYTATIQNSIIAMQTAGGDCAKEPTNGVVDSQGYNIGSDGTCGFSGTGDQENVASGDLKLGALASNGGPTQTMALGAGSVAIDQIDDTVNGCAAGVSADQRNAVRAGGVNKGGDACDVGAYEYNSLQTPNAVQLRALSGGPLGVWQRVAAWLGIR